MIEQATVEQIKSLIGQTVDGGKQQVLTAWIGGEDARLFVGRWYTVEEVKANGWINETGENRVLPAWAWELVDAEKNGAVIEYNFATSDGSEPEWVIRATDEMEHDNTQGMAGKAWWRIKPEPAELTESDFEIGWWEIHWRDGETSKAVVFKDNNDRLWLCCANWKGGSVRLSDCICQITEAYLVLTTDATE